MAAPAYTTTAMLKQLIDRHQALMWKWAISWVMEALQEQSPANLPKVSGSARLPKLAGSYIIVTKELWPMTEPCWLSGI